MQRKAALAVILAFALGGCASMRGVEVGSGSNTSVRVNVYNARTSAVEVSYADAGSTRQLGTVAAGKTESFVVVSQNPSVSLYARTAAGSNLGPYTVSLTGGGGQTITIR